MPGGHQRRKKIRLTAAPAFLRRKAQLLARLQQAVVEHEAALIEQKGRLGQFLQTDFTSIGQWMIHRQQGVELLIAKRLTVELRILWQQTAAQLQFTAQHSLLDVAATALEQLDADIRIAPPVFGKQFGE
ncbi:hypothetical protein D3C81_1535330 [compost metagenome]